jgi:hypothetical protein
MGMMETHSFQRNQTSAYAEREHAKPSRAERRLTVVFEVVLLEASTYTHFSISHHKSWFPWKRDLGRRAGSSLSKIRPCSTARAVSTERQSHEASAQNEPQTFGWLLLTACATFASFLPNVKSHQFVHDARLTTVNSISCHTA